MCLLFSLQCTLLKMQISLILKDFEKCVACIKIIKKLFSNLIFFTHLSSELLWGLESIWEDLSPHLLVK